MPGLTPPSPVRAVIFDLDGTLLDTESAVMAAGAEAFVALGLAEPPGLLHSLIGRDWQAGQALLRAALPEHHLSALGAEWDRRAALRLAEGINLRPTAAEVLARLGAGPLPLAVATSSARSSATQKMARAGIAAQFRTVVTADCVTRRKPAPDPFLEAARRLGVPPEHCVAFEDSDTGAESARAAGCWVVQVPDLVPTQGAWAHHLADDLLAGARAAGLLAA